MSDVIKRNAVNVTGSGSRTILFASGYGTDQRIWRYQVNHFREHYKLVLFDYVGAGDSDRNCYNPQRYSTLDGYAQDVIEIIEKLELRDVIFVGHSVSCIIGLLAAIQHPEYFTKLIAIAPSPCYINDSANGYWGGFEKQEVEKIIDRINDNYLAWAREVIPTVVNNADKPELIREIMTMFLEYDEDIARSFAVSTFFCDHRKDLLRLKTPLLILQASQDLMAPLQVGDYLNAHLQKSTLKNLQAKGHFPQLTSPVEVNQAMQAYLQN